MASYFSRHLLVYICFTDGTRGIYGLQYGGTCKSTRPTSTVNILIIIALVYKILGKY